MGGGFYLRGTGLRGCAYGFSPPYTTQTNAAQLGPPGPEYRIPPMPLIPRIASLHCEACNHAEPLAHCQKTGIQILYAQSPSQPAHPEAHAVRAESLAGALMARRTAPTICNSKCSICSCRWPCGPSCAVQTAGL